MAVVSEGVRRAPASEGVESAIGAEGVGVAVISEDVGLTVEVEGVEVAVGAKGIRMAVVSEGVVIVIDALITPISIEYYVIKRTYPWILVWFYYIISKVSFAITFNTFLCFNTFIIRHSILTKTIKEYAKGIAISSPS